jgi:hypothetical protein
LVEQHCFLPAGSVRCCRRGRAERGSAAGRRLAQLLRDWGERGDYHNTAKIRTPPKRQVGAWERSAEGATHGPSLPCFGHVAGRENGRPDVQPWAIVAESVRSTSAPVDYRLSLLAGLGQTRRAVVRSCPAAAHGRRPDAVHRAAAVLASAGVSRPRASLRLGHIGTRWRVRPSGQSAGAGALPRRTVGAARLHHPDARGTPAWHASVGAGRGQTLGRLRK